MKGELAEIKLHLFPNGMYVECDDIDDAEFIPECNIQPLVDFINDAQALTSPDTRFTLTEKGKQHLEQLEQL